MQGNTNTNAQEHINDCDRLVRDYDRIESQLQSTNQQVPTALSQVRSALREYQKWAGSQTHTINDALSQQQTSRAGQQTT
jgi:hypothetical protein